MAHPTGKVRCDMMGVCAVILALTFLVSGAGCLNMHWCPRGCLCYNQHSTVDCTNKGLTQLPVMSNLTQFLYLKGNDFGTLPERAFHQTPNLLKLDIRNSNLKHIESSAFCGLEKLKELDLSHNQLAALEMDGTLDCKLPELKELVLSANKLREIPRNLSSCVPNVEIINLHNNILESAAVDESFGQLKSLENLDVSLNRIHEIEKTDLDPLRDVVPLEILRLSDCGLVSIDPEAFVGFNNLTSLSLSRSLIPSHEVEALFRPFNVEDNPMAHLDISEMFLGTLTSDMLGMFHKLILLDASYSGVEYIQPELFDQLLNIETMHLEENSLSAIENIGALTKLRKLYLSGNQLSHIDLSNLTKLEVVNLSRNKFRVIPANWLCDSENLLLLNLSANKIDAIDRHAFTKVKLNTLDLSYNKLKVLGPMGTIRLRNLYLSHNQMLSVSSEAFYYMSTTLGELDLGYNQLTKLPLDIFEDFHILRRLCLHHNDFGASLQSGKQKDLYKSLGHLQELDLSYNHIQRLPSSQFDALKHLTTIDLQGNQISDLSQLSLEDLPSLAKLIISHNHLATINTEVLMHLELLEVFDLRSNPFECTCNLVPFLHWLESTDVIVLGKKNQSNHSCSFPPLLRGRPIFTYAPGSGECTEAAVPAPPEHHGGLLQRQRWTILGIVLGCILACVIMLGLVLYFGHVCQHIKSLHYRWQVRYREVSGVEIAGDPKA